MLQSSSKHGADDSLLQCRLPCSTERCRARLPAGHRARGLALGARVARTVSQECCSLLEPQLLPQGLLPGAPLPQALGGLERRWGMLGTLLELSKLTCWSSLRWGKKWHWLLGGVACPSLPPPKRELLELLLSNCSKQRPQQVSSCFASNAQLGALSRVAGLPALIRLLVAWLL